MLAPKFKQFHMNMRFIKSLSILVVSISLISACSTINKTSKSVASVITGSAPKSTTKTANSSAAKAYKSANKLMQRGNFQVALEEYNALILKYPFGAVERCCPFRKTSGLFRKEN